MDFTFSLGPRHWIEPQFLFNHYQTGADPFGAADDHAAQVRGERHLFKAPLLCWIGRGGRGGGSTRPQTVGTCPSLSGPCGAALSRLRLTGDAGRRHCRLQVVHTVNYKCRFWLEEWWHVSLAHQIEHHLTPKIPSEHHATIAPAVQRLCRDYGLPYRAEPFENLLWEHTMTVAGVPRDREAPAYVGVTIAAAALICGAVRYRRRLRAMSQLLPTTGASAKIWKEWAVWGGVARR